MTRHGLLALSPFAALLTVGVALLPACGGGGEVPAADDPRCVSLCRDDPHEVEGAFDVCSAESVRECLNLCRAQLEDADSSICRSCLLENAAFGVEEPLSNPVCHGGAGGSCASGQCELTGREGDCSYCSGNETERRNCLRLVYPRRDVHCRPTFRTVTECTAVCR